MKDVKEKLHPVAVSSSLIFIIDDLSLVMPTVLLAESDQVNNDFDSDSPQCMTAV